MKSKGRRLGNKQGPLETGHPTSNSCPAGEEPGNWMPSFLLSTHQEKAEQTETHQLFADPSD